jgi:hypothetical protein
MNFLHITFLNVRENAEPIPLANRVIFFQRGALRSSGTGSVRVQVRGSYGFRYGFRSVVRYGVCTGYVRGMYGVCTGSGTGPGGFEFGSAQRTENPTSQVGSY